MLSYMDKAFLYNPKSESLIKIAKEKGWFIVDENTILKTVSKKIW